MREIFDKLYNWLKSDGPLPWIAIAAAFYAFFPLGVFTLLFKLDVLTPQMFYRVFDSRNFQGAGSSRAKTAQQRKREYKNISRNMSSVSIDYFANMVGADFNVVMRDIQEMVLEGEFGAEAYIDYGLRRLVIDADAAEAQTGFGTSGRTQSKNTANSAKTTEKNNKKDKKDKKAYGGKETGLLVWGIILCAIGVFAAANMVDNIAMSIGHVTFSMIWSLVGWLCAVGAGGVLLWVRSGRKKRARRFTGYISIIGDRNSVSVSELARAVGVKESVVKKDIEIMLEKKLLDEGAYLDVGAGRLIIRQTKEENKAEESTTPADRYKAIIMEIRQLDVEIEDEVVSEKIDKIARLTAKIFKVVQDKPEKLPEIKSFMSYYLPTTLKLLRSYRDFEKQGVSGENIDATKKRIEKILDTLINGYSQQLDQLFKSDAIDISSDIDVLETMMRRDGLSKDDSGFQVQI